MFSTKLILAPLAWALMTMTVQSIASDQNCQARYTFSWSVIDACESLLPRGGTTKGPANDLDKRESDGWRALQAPKLTKFERDRRAILAMAGPYRTSFEFLEVLGFDSAYKPPRPYQSWGTEYVYVIEDRGDFISLQHIMVMYFESEAGEVSEPIVMKHWRQDWQYEKQNLLEYQGQNVWRINKYSETQIKGTWSQAVYQVDDSPRYETYGKWLHEENVSAWTSEESWRPLPRRERSIRNDYDVLEGVNTHTILSTGWVHEQTNKKFALGLDGAEKKYLAKEYGVNRYERIINHDFSSGDLYWQETSSYWSDVRSAWRERLRGGKDIMLIGKPTAPMFAPFFEGATRFRGDKYDAIRSRAYIDKTLTSYLKAAH